MQILILAVMLIAMCFNINCQITTPMQKEAVTYEVENNTKRSITIVETTEEINPTKTVKLQDYVHFNFNQSDVSFPFISSFFVLDLCAVELLANFTRSYSTKLSSRHLQLIDRYISEWNSLICFNCLPATVTSQNLSKVSIPEVVGNPEISFRIIKRLEFELPKILSYDTKSSWKELVVQKFYAKMAEIGVSHEDRHFVGFSLGLFRLHHVYNIPIAELLSSNFEDTIHIAVEIANNAFSLGHFGRASEWYHYGMKMYETRLKTQEPYLDGLSTDAKGYSLEEKETMEILLQTLKNVSMKFHDLWVEKKGPNSRPGLFRKPFYQMSMEEQIAKGYKEQEVMEASSMDESDDQMFRKLCQGHEPRENAILKHLKCRYDHRGSAWLWLMPAKVEVANVDPEILIFHGMISKKRMNFMKNISLPLQEEAQVQNENIHTGRHTKDRMSFVSWVGEKVHAETENLAHMISALTGLNASDEEGAAEQFQMNVYGSGGFYNVHEDAFNYYEKFDPGKDKAYDNGDRLATFMVYMNEVKAGGRTVFPKLGVSVEPEHGSAILWINLLNSGRPNKDMKHAGCPVISGIKWVMNRWIRMHDQMFIRPCHREVQSKIAYIKKHKFSENS